MICGSTYLFKLQHLQNKILRPIGNFTGRTPTCDLHLAFKRQYFHDFVTQLCRLLLEVTRSWEWKCWRSTGAGEVQRRSLLSLNSAVAKRKPIQVIKQVAIVAQVNKMKHGLQYQASADSGHVGLCPAYCWIDLNTLTMLHTQRNCK
jgi:hypothetical protein